MSVHNRYNQIISGSARCSTVHQFPSLASELGRIWISTCFKIFICSCSSWNIKPAVHRKKKCLEHFLFSRSDSMETCHTLISTKNKNSPSAVNWWRAGSFLFFIYTAWLVSSALNVLLWTFSKLCLKFPRPLSKNSPYNEVSPPFDTPRLIRTAERKADGSDM